MAEMEVSALKRHCVRRRLADQKAMGQDVAVWARRRDAATKRIDRPITTADARIRLRGRFPAFED